MSAVRAIVIVRRGISDLVRRHYWQLPIGDVQRLRKAMDLLSDVAERIAMPFVADCLRDEIGEPDDRDD